MSRRWKKSGCHVAVTVLIAAGLASSGMAASADDNVAENPPTAVAAPAAEASGAPGSGEATGPPSGPDAAIPGPEGDTAGGPAVSPEVAESPDGADSPGVPQDDAPTIDGGAPDGEVPDGTASDAAPDATGGDDRPGEAPGDGADADHGADAATPGALADPQERAFAPASVPEPGDTESVITVKVGGIRTSPTTVSGLAGVTLQLYDGGNGGPDATPRPEAWATCVSDADGDCNFVVPGTGPSGAQRNHRFWIKQTGAAPTGYSSNASLVVGDPLTSTAYTFRTPQLRGDQTYDSTLDFMIGSGAGAATASGGVWQVSRNNPPVPSSCGVDVALVLDLSESTSPHISDLRAAASSFVDSLTGTPSSVALFTFSSVAPAPTGTNLPLTPVSTVAGAQTVKSRIATYTADGTTNWDQGLYQVASSPTAFDIAVVITGGNPTVYANQEGSGSRPRFREVENGIFSANAIKAQGTRVIAAGVGTDAGASADNLRAISGPAAGSDYYQTADYASAAAALRSLALGACQGSVSVVKHVVPSATSGETITGAQPAGGWDFTATTTTPGVDPATQTGTTAAGTGAVSFPLTYVGGTSTGTVTIAETARPDHSLVTQGGSRAVCTDVETGDPVAVTNDPATDTGFTIDVPSTTAVSCRVYNRPDSPSATVTVDKTWVVNGTPYDNGAQPIGLESSLLVGGTAQGWAVPRTGLAPESAVEIAESTTFTGRDLCTLDSARITEANGETVSLPVAATVTPVTGANHYTLTNTVTCRAELTLAKQVQGGTAPPTAWQLDAVAPEEALPGPSGTSGDAAATAEVTPDVRYPLVETGNTAYVQTTRLGGVPIAPATGSWQCVQVDAEGAVVAGFNDGINGGVSVPLGYRVRCTAVNQTAGLTLVKQVVTDDGGTRVPADWTLTATPVGPVDPSILPVSATGAAAGTRVEVRPGTAYALSETGPGGYTRTSLRCDTGPAGTFVDATQVVLDALDEVTCVVVNDDDPAELTLVKNLEKGTTGATDVVGDWSLSATGPTSVVGAGGTTAEVPAGTYALAESGPVGYSASSWTCTGGTLSGANLTLANGDDVTCTITNTAVAPRLTLVKTIVNDDGGRQAADDVTLSATSGAFPDGVTISGFGGDASVEDVPVPVGDYVLSESTGDPLGYELTSLECVDGEGADLGVTAEDPVVTLALGAEVTCTFTNDDVPGTLTLLKEVDPGTSGSSAVPSDWTLTATPGVIPGQGPVSGDGGGGAGGVVDVSVMAGAYTLTESGPDGFDAGEWTCQGGVVEGAVVTVPGGGDVVCTITNTARTPHLTLTKIVERGEAASAAPPTAWTLTADGPTPVAGISGDETVTDAPVAVGEYTLGESGGPVGYTASAWTCDGGDLDGDVLTIAEGEDVACSITNTAQPSQWTIAKTSDPATGTAVASGDTIAYTVTLVHTGGVAPTGVVVTDDLTDVLDDATLTGTPTASAGRVEVVGGEAVWSVGTFTGTQTLAYTVEVGDNPGATLRNVVAVPPGATCAGTCETVHLAAHPVAVDLALTKVHLPVAGGAVDADRGDTIDYVVTVANSGLGPVGGAVVTDEPASSLTVVEDSVIVPSGWTATLADGVLTIVHDGVLEPGDSAEFSYTALVGAVPRTALGAYEPVSNTACVASEATDDGPSNDCATDVTPIKGPATTDPASPPRSIATTGAAPLGPALVAGGLLLMGALVLARRRTTR